MKGQARRGDLILRKLGWVSGLFALGSVQIEPTNIAIVDLAIVLYLVPIIAVIFDMYINGENYGIKRMGAFVRTKLDSELEGKWELFLVGKRDKFSRYALPLSSFVVIAACATILLHTNHPNWLVAVWAGINIAMVAWVYFYASLRLGKLDPQTAK
jgi:hypothetical protein